MKDNAIRLIEKYEELEAELARPEVASDPEKFNKIHKEFKGLEKAALKARE